MVVLLSRCGAANYLENSVRRALLQDVQLQFIVTLSNKYRLAHVHLVKYIPSSGGDLFETFF